MSRPFEHHLGLNDIEAALFQQIPEFVNASVSFSAGKFHRNHPIQLCELIVIVPGKRFFEPIHSQTLIFKRGLASAREIPAHSLH